MNLIDFKKTELAAAIQTELEDIKRKNAFDYDVADFLPAIFFSFMSIHGTEGITKKAEDRLTYYIKDHGEVLEHILINFMEVAGTDYVRWSTQKYNPITPLKLNAQCGMATPTYAYNKDMVH